MTQDELRRLIRRDIYSITCANVGLPSVITSIIEHFREFCEGKKSKEISKELAPHIDKRYFVKV